MSQISNDDTFILIIHTGYEERLTSTGLKANEDYKNIKDVFGINEFRDPEELGPKNCKDYIVAISAKHSEYYDVPKEGVKEVYGSNLFETHLVDSYPSILLDLATVVKKEVSDSHICVGNVNFANAFNLIQNLSNPTGIEYTNAFFEYIYVASIEIKIANSGRKFIIAELNTE